jgi:hypothetical protein
MVHDPKRIDFAKERKLQGRFLSSAVRELAEIVQPIAEQHGVNLPARLAEGLAQRSEEQRLLAERLQESVVSLFIADGNGQPDRIGSCVLVRLDSEFFAFTAAHVIRDVGTARLLAPAEGRGGRLLPLPPCKAHLWTTGSDNDLDVAVLALPSRQLGCFKQHVFLSGSEIDQDDRLDDQRLTSFYFVLGYSASRTQVQVDRVRCHIDQQSFHYCTGPISPAEYLQEQLPQADHIALDFDHKEIVIRGTRVTPPKLQGASGGGIFHISRETKQGPLVAIATQNKRSSRLIVGTRIKHFLAIARELKRQIPAR